MRNMRTWRAAVASATAGAVLLPASAVAADASAVAARESSGCEIIAPTEVPVGEQFEISAVGFANEVAWTSDSQHAELLAGDSLATSTWTATDPASVTITAQDGDCELSAVVDVVADASLDPAAGDPPLATTPSTSPEPATTDTSDADNSTTPESSTAPEDEAPEPSSDALAPTSAPRVLVANEDLRLDVTALDPDAYSGAAVPYRIQFTCTAAVGSCDNGIIDLVTTPDADRSGAWWLGNGGASCPAVVTGSSDRQLTLVESLPAGETYECVLTFQSASRYSPNGTEFNLEATFSADGVESVTADDTTTLQAVADLQLRKSIAGGANPVPGIPTEYSLEVVSTVNPFGEGAHIGTELIPVFTVTDTLPPGAELVDVDFTVDPEGEHTSYEVSGDVATGLVVTMTFDYTGSTNPPSYAGNSPTLNPDVVLSVVYPEEDFEIGDMVTNEAAVAGDSVSGVPYEADDSYEHGFDEVIDESGVSKRAHARDDDVNPGEEMYWGLSYSTRQNTVPVRLEIGDDLTSGPYGEFWRTTAIVAHYPQTVGPTGIEVFYTTNLNSDEQSLLLPDPGRSNGTVEVGVDGDIALDPETEWLESIRIVYPEMPPGVLSSVRVEGHYDPSVSGAIMSAEPEALRDVAENCVTLTSTGVGVETGVNESDFCNTVEVKVAEPQGGVKKANSNANAALPGDEVTWRLALGSGIYEGGAALQPYVVDLLPEEVTFERVEFDTTSAFYETYPEVGTPSYEVVENFNETGRTAVIFTWPAGEVLESGRYAPSAQLPQPFASIVVRVNDSTLPGPITNDVMLTDESVPFDNDQCSVLEGDEFDIDQDGDLDEGICDAQNSVTIGEIGALAVTKEVKGELDESFVTAPDAASVVPGGDVDYRLTLSNVGNKAAATFVAYDLLPRSGDTGALASSGPRGSEWKVSLREEVVAPEGFEVAYSTSENPCRDEIYPDDENAGCVDDWSTSPSDLSAVTGVRVSLVDGPFEPAASVEVTIPATLPVEGVTDFAEVGTSALNSAGFAGTRDDCEVGCDLLASETAPVEATVPGGSLTGVVSHDQDGDLLVDSGEELVGVDVTLECTDAYGRTVTEGPVATDGTGAYSFTNLLPGSCVVSVDETTLPDGLAGHTVLDPSGELDSTGQVDIEAGQETTDVDFMYSVASLTVEKSTNGQDADEAPGPSLEHGAEVTWEYVVTNTGDTALADVAVTDDMAVAIDCSDRDADSDGAIDVVLPGDSVTCVGTGSAVEGQYRNIGTATGDPVYVERDDSGDLVAGPDGTPTVTGPVPGAESVTDDDPSHYVGGPDPEGAAGIMIEKSTNGQDADEAPGPEIVAGTPVVWQYVVTNTARAPLAGVTVVDDQEGEAVYVSGDTDGDGLLDVGEAWLYTITGVATQGDYSNLAVATGSSPMGVEVEDDDPSHYTGVAPGELVLQKTVTASDDCADSQDALRVDAGTVVTWCFEAENVGGSPLTDVMIVDETLGIASDEMTLVSGDPSSVGPGEVVMWSYSQEVTESIRNVAVATTPTDPTDPPTDPTDPPTDPTVESEPDDATVTVGGPALAVTGASGAVLAFLALGLVFAGLVLVRRRSRQA